MTIDDSTSAKPGPVMLPKYWDANYGMLTKDVAGVYRNWNGAAFDVSFDGKFYVVTDLTPKPKEN